MLQTGIIPFLDPAGIIAWAGPWALVVVCFIIFAETGLLIGFLLPGDTLLLIAGLLSHPSISPTGESAFGISVWWVALLIGLSAFVGGEVGYYIGHKAGPAVFERKESGLFSRKNVERTNSFFERYGGLTIIIARWVPIVRTFAPVAAGVGHMPWRRYSLYNLIGAVVWGFGLTVIGYVAGFIPGLGPWLAEHIDLFLLIAVGGTIIVTVFHYVRERRMVAKELAAGGDPDTDAEEAQQLVLGSDAFGVRRRDQHAPEHPDTTEPEEPAP